MNAPAELIVRDSRAAAEPVQTLPAPANEESAMLVVLTRAAQNPNIDPERIERLYAIHRQIRQDKAEQEFVAAMATFKENPPRIVKDKLVSFPTDKGKTEYMHATLGAVCEAAIKGLAGVGISHRWDLEQLDGGMIRVTCVLTHRGGHSTRTALTAGRDESGKKNNIQAVASTVTYLQRYTLLAATGLATEDQDDDGNGAGKDRPRINEQQVADLEAMITEVRADKAKFLAFLKVDKVENIYADRYTDVVKLLEAKRRQA